MKFNSLIFLLVLNIFLPCDINAQNDSIPNGLDKLINKVRNKNINTKADSTGKQTDIDKNNFASDQINNSVLNIIENTLSPFIFLSYKDELSNSIRNNNGSKNNVFIGLSVGNKILVSDEIYNEQEDEKKSKSRSKNTYIFENYESKAINRNSQISKFDDNFVSVKNELKSNLITGPNSSNHFIVISINDFKTMELDFKFIDGIFDINKSNVKTNFNPGLILSIENVDGSIIFNLVGLINNNNEIIKINGDKKQNSKSKTSKRKRK